MRLTDADQVIRLALGVSHAVVGCADRDILDVGVAVGEGPIALVLPVAERVGKPGRVERALEPNIVEGRTLAPEGSKLILNAGDTLTVSNTGFGTVIAYEARTACSLERIA